jgi:hypothetical protein
VNNLTSTVFTKEETDILNLGFQHSFEKPIATNLFNIAIEAENAIKLLDINVQHAYRLQATKKLSHIRNSCASYNYVTSVD